MRISISLSCAALAWGVSLPAVTLAQTPPSAGSLLQQIEQGRSLALPKARPAEIAPAPPELKALPGPTVIVKSFRFAGNRLLSQAQLAPAVQAFLHRPLSFAELQEAAVAVAQAYRQAGWIVRTYLPRQKIETGEVTIQIVEAAFGGTQLEGHPDTRIAPERLVRRVEAAQATGAPLNSNAVDRALLLLEDLPGVAVQGNLKAGPGEGETSLLLKVTDKPLASGDASVDNGGSRSTGAEKLMVNLTLASPARLGDQATVSVMHTEGSDYGRLGYTLPAGADGWRIGANASWLKYAVIGMDAHGTSDTQGLEASYPIVRSRLKNLYLTLNYDRKAFDNSAAGVTTTLYRLSEFSLGLSGNLFDAFGGASSASLSLVSGKVDLDGSPNQASDAETTRTEGHFSKLRYSFNRLQALKADLAAYVAVSGQVAGKNLDSGEKFYLGGSGGVRAYPSSEGGGSDGMQVNLELRQALPANFSLSGFYDWGKVRVNHDNDFAGGATVNEFSLRGAGISLAWQGFSGMSLKGTWARRIGDNPNPTATGQDQDGTLVKNRFWLQAGLAF